MIEELLFNIKEIYNELDEILYSIGDYPMPPEKYLNNNPAVQSGVLERLKAAVVKLDEQLDSSGITGDILDLINEDTPIAELFYFDEVNYASDLVSNNIEAYDENLAPAQQEAADQAFERKTELLNNALDDIKSLMQELLPRLVD